LGHTEQNVSGCFFLNSVYSRTNELCMLNIICGPNLCCAAVDCYDIMVKLLSIFMLHCLSWAFYCLASLLNVQV